MTQAGPGEADQIDQQRQACAVMPRRDVDIDAAAQRLSEPVIGDRLAVDKDRVHLPLRQAVVAMHRVVPCCSRGRVGCAGPGANA